MKLFFYEIKQIATTDDSKEVPIIYPSDLFNTKRNLINFDIKYTTSKNRNIQSLHDYLMKLFLNEKFTFNSNFLSPGEDVLLTNIVRRKFGFDLSQNIHSFLTEISNKNEKEIMLRLNKRKEEKVKFIYKIILEQMKRDFEHQKIVSC